VLATALLMLGVALEARAFVPGRATTTRTPLTFVAPRTKNSASVLVLRAEPATATSFIQTELRGAAMRLHTRQQAPKEGEAKSPPPTQYTPTHADYLAFLVDSQHVYLAMEEIVHARDELSVFRDTGLERSKALEEDIAFMMSEYKLERPAVGQPGKSYAEALRQIDSIPEFVCHYYNHYFAHTAGGRMIGKQMSSLLLNGKTLEFYKVRTARAMWLVALFCCSR